MHKLLLATFATGLLAATSLPAQAGPDLEGRIISNVTFDCRGTIQAIGDPGGNSPSAFGQVQAVIDLPGNRTASLSGTIALGPDRGDDADLLQQKAPIDRCFGRGDLRILACDRFNGIQSCAAEMRVNNARIRVDRGTLGFGSWSEPVSTLMRGELGFITFGEGAGF